MVLRELVLIRVWTNASFLGGRAGTPEFKARVSNDWSYILFIQSLSLNSAMCSN